MPGFHMLRGQGPNQDWEVTHCTDPVSRIRTYRGGLSWGYKSVAGYDESDGSDFAIATLLIARAFEPIKLGRGPGVTKNQSGKSKTDQDWKGEHC
jgi:hypothetical protein